MKILHKKMAKDAEDPDTLITCNDSPTSIDHSIPPLPFNFSLLFSVTKKYHPDKKVRVHNGSVAKIESIDVSRE